MTEPRPYTPMQGSVAGRAIEYLREHGCTTKYPLAEMLKVDPNDLASSLAAAIRGGMVGAERRTDGHVYYWLTPYGMTGDVSKREAPDPDQVEDKLPVRQIVHHAPAPDELPLLATRRQPEAAAPPGQPERRRAVRHRPAFPKPEKFTCGVWFQRKEDAEPFLLDSEDTKRLAEMLGGSR